MKHLLNDEWVISVSSTILLHAILFIFFILFKVNFNPIIAEFVEVTFTGSFQSRALNEIEEKKSATEPEESLQNNEIKSAANTRTIDLPERRQLELNEEEIIENVPQEINKIVEGPPALKQTPVASLPPQKSNQSYNPFLKREKETNTGLFKKKLDDSLVIGSQKMDIPLSEEFEIDWIGDINREISNKKLPEFPPKRGIQN
jgi:hypothetical protein